MARPKKKPEYDSDQMAQQIMEAVTDAYLNPPQGTEDDTGHMQLKQLAEEFSMTPLKVRKLLITTGIYQTAISKAVNALYREGKFSTKSDFIHQYMSYQIMQAFLAWTPEGKAGAVILRGEERCSGTKQEI